MAAVAATVAAPPKPPDPIKTFASIVAGHKSNENITIKTPTTYKGEPAVFFSEEEINILAKPFKYTLVGKFPRGRPTMIAIRNFFAKLNLKDIYNIGLIDSKHILIHLQGEDDYHRIWLRTQWNIFQFPMQISKWHVNFTPETESPIVPIWVSMPYLPPHLFKNEAIVSIAKIIGEPMRVDTSTATLARPSKARVCVEADISKSLPRRGWIGQGENGFWQEFHYEDKPLYCMECCKIGHDAKTCLMKDNKHEAQTKATMTQKTEDKSKDNKTTTTNQRATLTNTGTQNKVLQYRPKEKQSVVEKKTEEAQEAQAKITDTTGESSGNNSNEDTRPGNVIEVSGNTEDDVLSE